MLTEEVGEVVCGTALAGRLGLEIFLGIVGAA